MFRPALGNAVGSNGTRVSICSGKGAGFDIWHDATTQANTTVAARARGVRMTGSYVGDDQEVRPGLIVGKKLQIAVDLQRPSQATARSRSDHPSRVPKERPRTRRVPHSCRRHEWDHSSEARTTSTPSPSKAVIPSEVARATKPRNRGPGELARWGGRNPCISSMPPQSPPETNHLTRFPFMARPPRDMNEPPCL